MATVLTDAGRAILTSRLSAGGTEPSKLGWGTGAGTAGVLNTTLFTEANTTFGSTGTRVSGTASQQTTTVASDTWQVVGTITSGGSNTITNAGLFDSATIGAGNLFIKGDFTGIGIGSGDSIAFTYKIQFN
jgi:hypothetical protein